MRRLSLHVKPCLLAVLAASVSIHAQTVKVMISGGFGAAYNVLAPQYEKSSGVHLDTVRGGSIGTGPGAIPVRLAQGEPADVVIATRASLDELVKQGLVVAGSQVDLGRGQIALGVRAGAAVPDISSVEAFRKVLLQAKSVANSDGTGSGKYVATELFKRMGIEKEMSAKIQNTTSGSPGTAVARGDAEIGFQQMSEMKPIPGVTVVGAIPEELQMLTFFSAGIVAKAPDPDAGRKLIRFLASPGACEVIRQTALDPVACPAGASTPGASTPGASTHR